MADKSDALTPIILTHEEMQGFLLHPMGVPTQDPIITVTNEMETVD